MEDRNRFADVTPAILLPIILSLCLVCGVAAGLLIFLSPGGANPFESLYLRAYITLNDDELNSTISDDDTKRRFDVLPGSTANDIGVALVTEGFISNGTLFARYAQYKELDDDFSPGAFYISEAMNIPEMVEILTTPTTMVRFTIRENMRLEEIGDQIAATPNLGFTKEEFLSLVRAGAPLPTDFSARYGIPVGSSHEGFLYPATYDVPSGMPAEDFVQMLRDRFDLAITAEILAAAQAQGRSIYQLVTIASIVEREAVLEDERATIAAVYWNRINVGMMLQADPTVQYQLANNRQNGIWWPQLTGGVSDYTSTESAGPYNTYQNFNLPPGPIVSPASRSIVAAAFPEATAYLFFQVACEGGGKHVFFNTGPEHDAYYRLRLNGCVSN